MDKHFLFSFEIAITLIYSKKKIIIKKNGNHCTKSKVGLVVMALFVGGDAFVHVLEQPQWIVI